MVKLPSKRALYVFSINVLAYITAYYTCILLHEWMGHGLAAWVLGEKSSPFDISYGGWALFHVDENVNYKMLINTNHQISAAIIAISGVVVTAILFAISLILLPLRSIQKKPFIFSLLYWA